MRYPSALGLLACLAALPGPAAAQDLSDDELLRLFQMQRDAFRAANASDNGQTRGLTLVTVEDIAASTSTPSLGEPAVGEDSGNVVAVTGDTTVNTGTTPEGGTLPEQDDLVRADTSSDPGVFGKLDKELQVNVNIQFDFDSAALNQEQKPKLAQLCNVMKNSDIALFQIVGHTDASGTDTYNERLSLLRAEEVQRYFVNDCGMEQGRLKAVGMGERFLSNQDDPRAGENRRVEFQALS